MSQELTKKMNPCPFCNSTDVDSQFALCASGEISAGCMTCGACGPQSKSEAEAVEAWNCCASGVVIACKEFVRKCENGEAKSVRSYAQMKTAIAKHEGGAK